MSETFGPYPARVDTVYLSIDLGFGHQIVSHDWKGRPWLACRIYGINAPELSTEEGKAARDYARSLLPSGSFVQVISHGYDKYGGRFDGEIILGNGQSFADAMLAAGHAKPFMTGTR